MTFEEYVAYFEAVLASPGDHPLYSDPAYRDYTRLNWSRMNRWLKKFEANDLVRQKMATIKDRQQWIVITEPWCGDAAHSLPQIVRMAELSPNIDLSIQLRDSEPHLIDHYLTNGGKSIPKLIVRNEVGEDLWVWGPRPRPAQALFVRLKEDQRSFDTIKEALQKWYNEDKGIEIQREFLEKLG